MPRTGRCARAALARSPPATLLCRESVFATQRRSRIRSPCACSRSDGIHTRLFQHAIELQAALRELPPAVFLFDDVGIDARMRHLRQLTGFAVIAEEITAAAYRAGIDLFQMHAAIPVTPIH